MERCEYCGKEFIKKQKTQRFCSRECVRNWFSNVYTKTKVCSMAIKNGLGKALKDGKLQTEPSSTHLIVCKLLEEMKIEFINEFVCGHYTIDIYFQNINLAIEVMGSFWHLDPRVHDKVENIGRRKTIKTDKAKKTYIKKYTGINILYLWEKDIIENIDLVKKLISEYISNNGFLIDYNSFNYSIINEDLILNDDIIMPYQEYTPKEIEEITEYTVKIKESKVQEDKWIEFDCEECGMKSKQLISKYQENTKHFCSVKCYQVNKRKRVLVNCNHCNKEYEIKQSKYLSRENKEFYCSSKCYNEHLLVIKKNKMIDCFCDYCKKEIQRTPQEYEDYKQHFCCKECQHKSKEKRIIFNCYNCGKEVSIKPAKYNKSKNHFCSFDCSVSYRSKKQKNKKI